MNDTTCIDTIGTFGAVAGLLVVAIAGLVVVEIAIAYLVEFVSGRKR